MQQDDHSLTFLVLSPPVRGTPDLWGQSLWVRAEFQGGSGLSETMPSPTETSQNLGFCQSKVAVDNYFNTSSWKNSRGWSAGKMGPHWGFPRVPRFRCSSLARLCAPPGPTRPACSTVLPVPSTEPAHSTCTPTICGGATKKFRLESPGSLPGTG